jgi:hypothetical protein
MKRKTRRSAAQSESLSQRNEQVRREIQNFLEAVNSYPERVAREPQATFQQHLCSFFRNSTEEPCSREQAC